MIWNRRGHPTNIEGEKNVTIIFSHSAHHFPSMVLSCKKLKSSKHVWNSKQISFHGALDMRMRVILHTFQRPLRLFALNIFLAILFLTGTLLRSYSGLYYFLFRRMCFLYFSSIAFFQEKCFYQFGCGVAIIFYLLLFSSNVFKKNVVCSFT